MGLKSRAGLPDGLGGAVELASLKIIATHQGPSRLR